MVRTRLRRIPQVVKQGIYSKATVDAVDEWPLIRLFWLRGKEHMGDAILEAVVRQSSLAQKLRLAVKWDDNDMLEEQLGALPAWHESRESLLRRALQMALEWERPKIVGEAPSPLPKIVGEAPSPLR